MKLVVHVSVMVNGIVSIDLDEMADSGEVTVVTDKDFAFTAAQVVKDPGDSADFAEKMRADEDLKNVAILRVISRAFERWSAEVRRSVDLQSLPAVKKGEAS